MSRWFRHYAGMMRDDKLVRAALKSKQSIERVCWIWGAVLESAAELDDAGRYEVDVSEIAYFLRCRPAPIEAVLSTLKELGRINDTTVLAWDRRQFKSDRSNARVAAHREKVKQSGNATCNVTEPLPERDGNSPETETETETETEKKKEAASVVPEPAREKSAAAGYAFEGETIRLSRRDHEAWRKAYHAIPDLDAELRSIDTWYSAHPAKRKDWFHGTSGMLNRKHQEFMGAAKSNGYGPGHSGIPI